MAMLADDQEILDGRFKICKRLGSGAFGEIFKVQKKKTGEFYAAKIVSNTDF
jgi:serine/threonine protein kinase